MNPASNVKKAGNSPNGNKLHAQFPGPEYPDFVQIKGTTDKESLNGNSGNWNSRNKYSTAAVTLQLIKGGVVAQEDAYDSNGNLANPDAVITNFTLAGAGGNDITATWVSSKENSVSIFALDRKLSSASAYDQAVQITFPSGAGSSYNVMDSVPASGTYNYRLRAVFENGADKVLAESAFTISSVPTPDATVSDFTLTPNSGNVDIAWRSGVEVSITRYDIDRKEAAAATYDQAIQIAFPTGAGSSYAVQDIPPSSGSYTYRLRAVFDTGADKIVAEGSITV